MRYVLWGLQILILAVGIHLFLRFVRTTRGNRLIRGLFLSVMVGVVGLWGLSRALELEELEHLLRSSTGFIVVGFVVIFQSELRRGIAQLGERSFLGFAPAASGDAVREAVGAARALAAVRRGALLVFERETSLHSVLESGTALDAEVRAPLLESLFHPETPLHDGAVVLRKDRVAAAGCILPLSEEALPSPTMGTRHRAGLGLAEESDAVVLIVSEESGSISLAKDGKLHSDVAPEELERELGRLLLGRHAETGEPASLGAALLRTLRHDLAWLPGSLLLAVGIFYIAHQGLQESREFHVRFVDGARRADKEPRPDEVLVLFDNEASHLVEGPSPWSIEVRGTRRQLEEMRGSVRGLLRVEDPDWEGGPVSTRDILWRDEGGLQYAWKAGVSPELIARRFEERAFRLRPEQVVLDTSTMNPRLAVRTEGLRFDPGGSVTIRGPVEELDRLGSDTPIALEPVAVLPEDREELRRRIELEKSLRDRGLVLSSPVVVVVPLEPVPREIGMLTREVALVCLDPSRTAELENWRLPPQAQTARFSITTLGLIPDEADPAAPATVERLAALRRFVEDNLRVFVDVAELTPGGESRSARVRWAWKDPWTTTKEAQQARSQGARADLDVELVSDVEVLLEPSRAAPRDP